MPETMRPEDEARLCAALADVADWTAAGGHPDAAIAKAAAARDVPCGHVRLLAQAYNIGRTARQRDEGETVAAKAASFPLASTAAVLERLFPAAVTSAAAKAAAVRVSPEYAAPPDWYTRPREKAAAAAAIKEAWGMPLPGTNARLPFGMALQAAGGGVGAYLGGQAQGGLPGMVGGMAAGMVPGMALTAYEASRLRDHGRKQRDEIAATPEHDRSEQDRANLGVLDDLDRGGELGKAAGSEEWRIRHALGDCDRRAKAAAAARLPVTALEARLLAKLASLEDYFRSGGALPLGAVRGNVAALHGGAGTLVLDRVARACPHLVKAAVLRHHRHAVTPGLEPYATIAQVLETSQALHDAALVRDKAAAWAEAANAAARAALVPPRPGRSVLDAAAEKSADITGGVGYALGTEAIEAVGRGLNPPGHDALVAKTLSRIATPEHEQELQAIEARAHLHELLNRDDQLKGRDPREVAEHYNRISDFAPVASRRPLMATPLVRKSLQQGSLDMFDAKELADAERSLRPLHHPGAAAAPAPRPQEGAQKHASRSVLE